MSKTDELISKLEEGKNPEPLKHAIERLKKDAIRSQIGYIFPNEHYIECSGIIMACDQILEWIDSEISSLKEQIKKEETLPSDDIIYAEATRLYGRQPKVIEANRQISFIQGANFVKSQIKQSNK